MFMHAPLYTCNFADFPGIHVKLKLRLMEPKSKR